METPLSSRRITRSSRLENQESTNKGFLKSRNQERENSALIDITNGSPIVGLAMGSLKTPSSRCSKKRMMIPNSESKNATTPGSGETLLRGQVKTLLKKVEEEGVISKICFEPNPLIYKRFLNSPMAVLAPTPANTPQVYNFSNNNGLESFTVSPVAENFSFTQLLNEVIAESNKKVKGEKHEITRSLFMDDSESSDCNSLLTCEDSNSSGWSVQVNVSTSEEEHKDNEVVDELCEGMSKISVNKTSEFSGKHTRFVYDSDEETEGELLLLSSSSKGSI
ncbi:hypothetical protein HanRHA438_Chr09g0399771 [Helianthus annuus]|uniref:Putative chalcone-flavanone isomerase family protein n=1 Tax=Helianthus annuus TaxID=4232 RepID=A0A251TX11_HELAN|nr:uncharacterized protein LOC110878469 [Helianthus annuus]KAF5790881.1 hypothetical protein HanXRQr2_Chr09g0388281 [Helianthus annuus]KAJ0526042.1 hypothetical protein HanHA300_Chr09g0318731 [Helianthus annuus]KAJ0534340.1 hypothetical protein HanIR_Chr09g0418621 [Helianthus annuus]KAJ0542437.1 hypothetical protein HanHA89_Chr09g0339711 [Helianthus annuus]KAJ0888238.1 hypothetical protein HanRHA438_Chr09g0399771 [Helianthus annuus]